LPLAFGNIYPRANESTKCTYCFLISIVVFHALSILHQILKYFHDIVWHVLVGDGSGKPEVQQHLLCAESPCSTWWPPQVCYKT